MSLEIQINASQVGMSSNVFQRTGGPGIQRGNLGRSSSPSAGGRGMLSLIKNSSGIGTGGFGGGGKGGSIDIVI